MRRVAQARVQVLALLETAGVLTNLHDLRLDLINEGGRTGRVVEGDKVTNVDKE